MSVTPLIAHHCELVGENQGTKSERRGVKSASRKYQDTQNSRVGSCGSTQPRTLYTLKDQDPDRFFFVGATCLKELVKAWLYPKALRAGIGASGIRGGDAARSEELMSVSVRGTDGAAAPLELIEPQVDEQSASPSCAPALFPVVLVVEALEHYKD